MDKDQNIRAIQNSLREARYLKIKEFFNSRFNDVTPPCTVYTCVIDYYDTLAGWCLDNSSLKNFEGLDISYYENLIETKATDLEAIGLYVIEQKVK